MAMVSVGLLAEEMGMETKDVRRIARSEKLTRYKDARVELYNSEDFEKFGKEKMMKRVLSPEHKAALQRKKKK
jgi:hypothetical protein